MAMDPFCGLGSTAVACARLGVSFIGADIDEVYMKEAVARMRETTASKMRKAGLKPATSSRMKSARARA
jgi:site-specific DNA-methyltransferase (adenine-specific)